MDLDYIESLAELLAGSQVTELTVRRGDQSITLRRRPGGTPQERALAGPADQRPQPEPVTDIRPVEISDRLSLAAALASPTALVPAESGGDNGVPEYEIVRAHRVGIFHRGATAADQPLVQIGEWIPARTQLGSIESMCLFDEVDCPQSGVVVGVFVPSGSAVEYGQPLFHLEKRDRPAGPGPNGEV